MSISLIGLKLCEWGRKFNNTNRTLHLLRCDSLPYPLDPFYYDQFRCYSSAACSSDLEKLGCVEVTVNCVCLVNSSVWSKAVLGKVWVWCVCFCQVTWCRDEVSKQVLFFFSLSPCVLHSGEQCSRLRQGVTRGDKQPTLTVNCACRNIRLHNIGVAELMSESVSCHVFSYWALGVLEASTAA